MRAGITFDAGGLIALERGDRRALTLVTRAQEVGAEIVVPASALAQVLRQPRTQARLMRLLRQPGTRTVALDRVDASFVGQLLAATRTTDVADAHVAICARRAGHAVVTTDGDDLRHLDPSLELIEV